MPRVNEKLYLTSIKELLQNSGNVKNASECQLSGGAGNFSRSKRSSGAPDNQGTGKGNSSLRRNTSGARFIFVFCFFIISVGQLHKP